MICLSRVATLKRMPERVTRRNVCLPVPGHVLRVTARCERVPGFIMSGSVRERDASTSISKFTRDHVLAEAPMKQDLGHQEPDQDSRAEAERSRMCKATYDKLVHKHVPAVNDLNCTQNVVS